jgi:peptidoglycan hydrolase-like protein with peptidoglycan-binding domain
MPRLRASVGEGGANLRGDAKYVQFLLCDWRLCNGGSALAVDGIVGPLTKAAILEFQNQQTGLVDGRVDPHGPAIRALESIHLDNIVANISASLLQYFGLMRVYPPAAGPLTASEIVARYLSALRDDFGP